jgi:formylglycine-generating enzyme required for sulfatase activity
MGAPGGEPGRPEGPVRQVSVPAFGLARTETTHGQYAAFVAATGHQSATKGCRRINSSGTAVIDVAEASWRDPGDGRPVRADAPVTCVSWRDAIAYAAWLTQKTGKPYRLPSEAEWEYAARAGANSDFPWGDNVADGCRYANLGTARPPVAGEAAAASCEGRPPGVMPVAKLRPNAFGVYDMIGNVWEWTADCYVAPYPADAPTDGRAYQPAGACERRSVRGGSWITQASRQRPAWRGRDPETLTNWIFGFRVARSESPVAKKKN